MCTSQPLDGAALLYITEQKLFSTCIENDLINNWKLASITNR